MQKNFLRQCHWQCLQHCQDQMIRANENIIDIYENIIKKNLNICQHLRRKISKCYFYLNSGQLYIPQYFSCMYCSKWQYFLQDYTFNFFFKLMMGRAQKKIQQSYSLFKTHKKLLKKPSLSKNYNTTSKKVCWASLCNSRISSTQISTNYLLFFPNRFSDSNHGH